MKKLNILILEDRDEDLMLLVHTLKQSGLKFEYVHVSQEHEYLRELKNSSPDIILSDYGLHSYNGLNALRHMREAGQDCPFILVTGSLPDEIAVECLKAGADDYILKDRLNRLPDAIRQAIDRRQAEVDRRHAFSELLRSQRRLEAAERMAKVGNWEWHIGTSHIVWSDEMYRIMGVGKEGYSPSVQSFMDFVLPEDVDRSIKVAQRISSGEETEAESNFRIRTPQGETKMLRSIYRSNGKPAESGELKVFGTMQDITRQFLAEKGLREMTEKLEQKVEERTEQLSCANKELRTKNEEMTDSINYAHLIQKALLAKLNDCRQLFPKSFILWKPKDVVSGDFHWQYRDKQYDFIAAVDCTGHGVPGALMSMIGHQLLNHVVIEEQILEPADILTELNEQVSLALKQDKEVMVRDGMDMVLCRIDREKKQMCFSGAYRPLFHVHGNEVSEYEADRIPIGNSIVDRTGHSFTQTCVQYSARDTIYLTSDGYYDQFGGPKGKKMMKSNFKNLLAQIGSLPINDQYAKLTAHLKEWQGGEAQVDDILVIGIQF